MNPAIKRVDEKEEFEIPERCFILEVGNDAGDEAASISRARVPAGVTTEWHYLEGIDERYIVISGVGRAEVGTLDPANVGPGGVVRIPAGVRQRITNIGTDDLIFFCVCTPRFRAAAYKKTE